MAYTKRIVCLANSRKNWERCVAGKEALAGGFGRWVRPVSPRPSGELTLKDRCYTDGGDPAVLDIIEVPLIRPRPHRYQTENHVIDETLRWKKVGALPWRELGRLVDDLPRLWINGEGPHYHRMPMDAAAALQSSLALIHVDNLVVHMNTAVDDYGKSRKRYRASFTYRALDYRFSATDPTFDGTLGTRKDGDHPIGDAYLCLSLSEEYKGYVYKLVATVVTQTPL